jgi:hypothetical protein
LAALASDNDNLDNLNSQNSPTNSPTVNVRNVPAGVYLLRVRDAEGKDYMRKIMKK